MYRLLSSTPTPFPYLFPTPFPYLFPKCKNQNCDIDRMSKHKFCEFHIEENYINKKACCKEHRCKKYKCENYACEHGRCDLHPCSVKECRNFQKCVYPTCENGSLSYTQLFCKDHRCVKCPLKMRVENDNKCYQHSKEYQKNRCRYETIIHDTPIDFKEKILKPVFKEDTSLYFQEKSVSSISRESPDSICSICIDKTKDIVLNCHHTFCESCIKRIGSSLSSG